MYKKFNLSIGEEPLLEFLYYLCMEHNNSLEEVSEDAGSFNLFIASEDSFNFDWRYTTIVIHTNMYICGDDFSEDAIKTYNFVTYHLNYYYSCKVNGADITDDDVKYLIDHIKIAFNLTDDDIKKICKDGRLKEW